MKACRLLLISLVLASAALPASAGIFPWKRTRPNAQETVPALIATVKTDPDDDKREKAAERLADYDAVQFPDIVPVLLDVMQHDFKAGVRSEAALSLARIHPVTPEVGRALEQVAEKDSSFRVRMQARRALLHYHLNGYHAGTNDTPHPPAGAKSDEPPLATVLDGPLAPSPNGTPPARIFRGPTTARPLTTPPAPVVVPAPATAPAPANAPPKTDGPDLSPPE